jgi:hypothetical protein
MYEVERNNELPAPEAGEGSVKILNEILMQVRL